MVGKEDFWTLGCPPTVYGWCQEAGCGIPVLLMPFTMNCHLVTSSSCGPGLLGANKYLHRAKM